MENRIIRKILPFFVIERLKHLLAHHVLSLSQAGQDLWVYGELFNERKKGFFLDIGAHDGFYLSNTYLLEKRYHWSGICIEANPLTFEKLQRNRRCVCINKCIDNKEGFTDYILDGVMGGILGNDVDNDTVMDRKRITLPTIPLANLLVALDAPKEIDYFSIDIEGAEDRALLSFDFDRYLFKSMTIERPSTELREILQKNNYVLIKDLPGFDCFYVHSSFLQEYLENVGKFGAKKFLTKRLK